MIFIETAQPAFIEQRCSYRIPLSGPRRNARLRIGGRVVAVQIVDESAHGCAVIANGTLDCAVGQTLLLEIASAWTEVQVMHVQVLEPKASDASDDDCDTPDPQVQTKLGLLRVREVGELEYKKRTRFSWLEFKSLAVTLSPLRGSVGSTVGLVCGAFLTGAVLYCVLDSSFSGRQVAEHHSPTSAGKQAPLAARNERAAEPRAVQPRVKRSLAVRETKTGDNTTQDRPQVVANERRPAAASVERLTSRPSVEVLPEKVVRQSHPDYFLKPDVSKALALSDEQLDQLRSLKNEPQATGAAANNSVAATTAGADDPVLLLGQRSLAILTDLQRLAVQQLLSKSEAQAESTPAAKTSTGEDGP